MRTIFNCAPDNVISALGDWDKLMGEFFGSGPNMDHHGYPRVDIREEKDRYVLEAELPGMGEKDVEIKLRDSVLTLESAKTENEEKSEELWLIRERKAKGFRRAFTLPRNIESEAIAASFKDGLLTISLPKSPQAQEKTININRV